MISNFNSFKSINEEQYTDLKEEHNSLGEYVEYLYNNIEEDRKPDFERVLGQYLKTPTKKYNSKKFETNDYVLIEYWHRDFLTPVKIINRHGRKYTVTHNIEESEIKNAPDEIIKKEAIVDHYRETKDNKKETNIPTDIKISNSVNLLKPYDQMILVKKLQDEFKIESDINEKTKFDIKEIKNTSLLGQIGFNSFLKVLSALNLPNIQINRENCPNDFFIIFVTEIINTERISNVMSRFRSMENIRKVIEDNNDPVRVYFGLKMGSKLMLEYGIIIDEKRFLIGEYTLNKKNYTKLIKEKDHKFLLSLKKQIENIELSDLKKMMKIKSSLTEFSPGYYIEKTNPYIENGIIIQGYQGTGKWISGTITSKSYNDIKETFKKWMLTKNWAKSVKFNIKPENLWVWIKVKI